MNGEINRLDDLFREGMEGHQEMPSPGVWDKIEEELDKKDRRRPFILFFSSYKKIAAVFIIGIISASLFAGSYLLIKKYSSKNTEDITNNQMVNVGKPEQQKENQNKLINTQPKEITTHHIPVDTDTKILNVDTVSEKHFQLTDNLKDQPVKQSPSNEAVANRPYVQESVPFKNKTVVAGSQTIPQSADKVDNNALAVKATEEQTNLASIAKVQSIQHDFGLIEGSVVLKQPIPTKTPTKLSAPAATVTLTRNETTAQIPVLDKKKKKKINFSITPISSLQFGKTKSIERIPVLTFPQPPNPIPPIIRETTSFESTNFKPSLGLLTGLHLGNSISIQSGFYFSRQFYSIDQADATAKQRPDGRIKYALNNQFGIIYIDPKSGSRPIAGDIKSLRNINISYNYLQLPFLINYYVGRKTIQGFFTAGVNISFLNQLYVKADITPFRENHKINDKETFLKAHFENVILGAGVKWNINNKYALIFNPQYQFGVSPFNTPPFTKAYQRNLTIQTGIQVTLRK